MTKKCKDDEILNLQTNRCVKKSGKIGKMILQKEEKKTETRPNIYIPKYVKKRQDSSSLLEKIFEIKKPIPKIIPVQTKHARCSFVEPLKEIFPDIPEINAKYLNILLKGFIQVLVHKIKFMMKSKGSYTLLKKKDVVFVCSFVYNIHVEKKTIVYKQLETTTAQCLMMELTKSYPEMKEIETPALFYVLHIIEELLDKLSMEKLKTLLENFDLKKYNIKNPVFEKLLFGYYMNLLL